MSFCRSVGSLSTSSKKIGLVAVLLAAGVALGGCPNPNLPPPPGYAQTPVKKQTKAAVAASQTKISSQTTLNTPSKDAEVNPTAIDSRRSETAFGHPQF
jgi:hypothetical protein